MTKSSSRQQKRATKSAARRASRAVITKGKKPPAEVSIDPAVQGVKIAALEVGFEKLVKMTQSNHREIIRAFSLSDAHQWVLMQIAKDLTAGTVMLLSKDPPVLDVAAYYDLYNAKQRADAQRAAQQPTETKGEDHDVFGGDLNDENPKGDAVPEEGEGSGAVIDGAGDQEAPLQLRESGSAHAGA